MPYKNIEDRKAYQRKWAKENKDKKRRHRKRTRTKWGDKSRNLVWRYLRRYGCKECGIKDPIVLEFDHRDMSDKKDNISSLIYRDSYSAVKDEIRKCDILCANCHRRRTAKQQQKWYTWRKG